MKLSKLAPKRKDSGNRQHPEEGVWGATLFKIAIIGRHAPRGTDKFNKGVRRLIRFTFEMPEQLMKDENGVEDSTRPFIASIDVPFFEFLAHRAKMTSIIKSIAGDQDEVDLKDLIGKPADIHITVTEDAKGNKWTNIEAVTPMKEKDKKDWPEPINPVCYFNFYDPDIEEWEKLYDWEKARIKEAVDFPSSKLEGLISNTESEPKEKADTGENEDIPF